MIDIQRLRLAYEKVREELLAERTADGHWVGELSSSALSTATAISALSVVRSGITGTPSTEYSVLSTDSIGLRARIDELIPLGVDWLVKQQNSDGGFGDTDLSHSNIATTYLVIAALHLAGVADSYTELIGRANAYIDSKGRLEGLRERYGIDKTFVVPIMTNLALAGLVDWRQIDPLPFELACVPQSWYRFVGMPVVSYAIPALVAIGQARFFHAPPRNPLTRMVRRLSINRSLKVLRRMQPDSGGYLEATPLTSFVVMSLASLSNPHAPRKDIDGITRSVMPTVSQVICEGVKFLINSARPDGSWPIDTNLATWNTTLAINALAGAGEDVAALLGPKCLAWLLSCQHINRHPFTGANPGGFGWSDLSGAVPDADDTPGAILTLAHWYRSRVSSEELGQTISRAAAKAIQWLFGLQNSDRGWPTFCRGWGRLPFDRSGSDLTAHAIRAIQVWRLMTLASDGDAAMRTFEDCGLPTESLEIARTRGADYLVTHQNEDGSWSPLWFGNQDHPQEDNLVYGTAKSLFAYRDHNLMEASEAKRGTAWLVANQNEDGGWGSGVWARRSVNSVLSTQYSVLSTPNPSAVSEPFNPKSKIQNLESSVEETALAVEALLAPSPQLLAPSPAANAAARGLAWLLDRVENGQHRQPAPIGFYFAKLWYYERLYPLIFTVAALGRACRQFAPPTQATITTEPSESRAS